MFKKTAPVRRHLDPKEVGLSKKQALRNKYEPTQNLEPGLTLQRPNYRGTAVSGSRQEAGAGKGHMLAQWLLSIWVGGHVFGDSGCIFWGWEERRTMLRLSFLLHF